MRLSKPQHQIEPQSNKTQPMVNSERKTRTSAAQKRIPELDILMCLLVSEEGTQTHASESRLSRVRRTHVTSRHSLVREQEVHAHGNTLKHSSAQQPSITSIYLTATTLKWDIIKKGINFKREETQLIPSERELISLSLSNRACVCAFTVWCVYAHARAFQLAWTGYVRQTDVYNKKWLRASVWTGEFIVSTVAMQDAQLVSLSSHSRLDLTRKQH